MRRRVEFIGIKNDFTREREREREQEKRDAFSYYKRTLRGKREAYHFASQTPRNNVDDVFQVGCRAKNKWGAAMYVQRINSDINSAKNKCIEDVTIKRYM